MVYGQQPVSELRPQIVHLLQQQTGSQFCKVERKYADAVVYGK